MGKKMDVNFAFAILLLIAAIVGMYFWLDRGNVEVEEIYQDTDEAKIERSADAEEMGEGEMAEDEMGDGEVTEMEKDEEMMEGEMQK